MAFPLELLHDTFAISRLDPDAPIPEWVQGEFVSITRTSVELSIVCRQDDVPDDVQSEQGWRCLRIVGKLDLSLVMPNLERSHGIRRLGASGQSSSSAMPVGASLRLRR